MSQPAVTKIIQSLESQLNCELMIRSKRGIELTPDGLRFFNMIAPSCEALISVEQCIKSGQLDSGVVTVSTSPAMFDKLTSVILTYRKKYPDVSIHIDSDEPEMKRQYLKDKSRDIVIELEGIINKDKNLLDGWNITTICGAPMRAYVGEGLAALLPDPVHIETLLSYPLLAPDTEGFYEKMSECIGTEYDTKSSLTQFVGSLPLQKILAAMDEGILLTSDISVTENLAAHGLVRLDVVEPLPVWNIEMYTQDEKRMSPAAIAFKNLLLKMMLGVSDSR